MFTTQCETFLIKKSDMNSFIVIVRNRDNSWTNVEGFRSSEEAREWIKGRLPTPMAGLPAAREALIYNSLPYRSYI